jgi:hypothetical protein
MWGYSHKGAAHKKPHIDQESAAVGRPDNSAVAQTQMCAHASCSLSGMAQYACKGPRLYVAYVLSDNTVLTLVTFGCLLWSAVLWCAVLCCAAVGGVL